MSQFQRRGIGAEAEIKKRLVHFSDLAKPEPDQGIDFICQLSEDFSPISRFFGVQAKGTRQFDKYWRNSFPKSTVERWLRLPFPVFIIVYNESDHNCYWMSVTHNLPSFVTKLQEKVDAKTIRIEMDKSHLLEETGERNADFIEAVKDAHMRISLILGRPEFGESYVREMRYYILSNQVRTRLRDHIRDNMNYLIYHFLFTKNFEKAYSLCKFLIEFDKSHYDHFLLFARMCHYRGEKEEALRYYDEAIRMLKADKKWDKLKSASQHSTAEIITLIEAEKERLKSR